MPPRLSEFTNVTSKTSGKNHSVQADPGRAPDERGNGGRCAQPVSRLVSDRVQDPGVPRYVLTSTSRLAVATMISRLDMS